MKHPDDTRTIDLVDTQAETAAAKRGRKPMTLAEPVTDVVDAATAAVYSQAATAVALNQAAIAQAYGDGLPYQRERVVHEAQFYLAQSAEAMLEAGKRLIQIKEHEEHGVFIDIVQSNLGMEKRTAQRMMGAAAKYLAPRLAAKATTLSLLGRSKMFDLMNESDEDIESLVDGGTLAGHTFDEIEAMSARELKAALRDHKQQLEAKDKVLADRNAKVDRLEQRLHRPYKPSKEAAARTAAEKLLLDDVQQAAIEAHAGMVKIVEVMVDMASADISASCRLAAHSDLIWLAQRLAEVMREHAIAFDLETAVVPSWVREHSAKLKTVQS
jgi:hypothetical protein